MSNKIIFNGTQYDSLEDMPQGLREAYQKALRLAAQGSVGGAPRSKVAVRFATKVRFVQDGKTYDSIDQMPAEVRAKFEAAMRQVDKDHDGIPDFLESASAEPASLELMAPESPLGPSDALAPSSPPPPVITPDEPSNRLMVVAGVTIVALILVVLGLVLYIMQH